MARCQGPLFKAQRLVNENQGQQRQATHTLTGHPLGPPSSSSAFPTDAPAPGRSSMRTPPFPSGRRRKGAGEVEAELELGGSRVGDRCVTQYVSGTQSGVAKGVNRV